ncbi:histidine racemase CntK [Staphylococcus arlettae]|uniref:histidine racemase CntK n=1 Tax=Staphylococcus arlettae TaxID=29378 RepID=UPI003EE046B0
MQANVIHFSKYNPTGNMTVLVHSQHDSANYSAIAQSVMSESHLFCEQVGFMIKPFVDEHYELVMSGKEFCGNAALSFAHYLYSQKFITKQNFKIKMSGISHQTHCYVHKLGLYEVGMPRALEVDETVVVLADQHYDAVIVTYKSYQHIVLPVSTVTEDLRQACEHYVQSQQWPTYFKTIGLLLYDAASQNMTPLIYVPEVNSLVWEHSCASGTASIGAYYTYRTAIKCEHFTVNQPGGPMWVSSNKRGQHYHMTIKGHVTTVATGLAYI